jgi:nucleotide-binding universal stress UspA family protein
MYKHILIPTDGSPLSRKAIESGTKLAALLGAKVTGLFAAPPATPVVYKHFLPAGYSTMQEHAEAIEKATERYLAVIQRAAKAAGVSCDCIHITSDFPADAILAVAKKRDCDLIVMASHGRRGASRLLLGSETQKVVTHSLVPVLVIR